MPLVWGEEWKMDCPTSPKWESEGEAWSEDESVSSDGSRDGKVGNNALHVDGLGPVTRSLFSCRIGSWQRWHQAATWPWRCCARKCMRPGGGCGYPEDCCHGIRALLSPRDGP